MEIEFDLAKSDKKERERGLPFTLADEFDWETAGYGMDRRRDYGESRFKALGYINGRLHVVFLPRDSEESRSSVYGKPTGGRR